MLTVARGSPLRDIAGMRPGEAELELGAELDLAFDRASRGKGALYSMAVTGGLFDDGRHTLKVYAWWRRAHASDDAYPLRLDREILVQRENASIDGFDVALAWIARCPDHRVELEWMGAFDVARLADRWRTSCRALGRGARVTRCEYLVLLPDDLRSDRPPYNEGRCEVTLGVQSLWMGVSIRLGKAPFGERDRMRAEFDRLVAEYDLSAIAEVKEEQG